MKNKWSDAKARAFVARYEKSCESDVALLAYATRLVGGEPSLALHGGGNTSVKTTVTMLAGTAADALFVKASGAAMDGIDPSGFVCLDCAYLKKLRSVTTLTDEAMADEFRTRMLRPSAALPSVETLMHAFINATCVVHTHPAAILTLTNREDAEAAVRQALGKDAAVLPYVDAGLSLGRAVADAVGRKKDVRCVVVLHHGLIAWGSHPKQAYATTIEMANRAEEYIKKNRKNLIAFSKGLSVETARNRYAGLAPMLRGLLSPASGNPDAPHQQVVPVAAHLRGGARAPRLGQCKRS